MNFILYSTIVLYWRPRFKLQSNYGTYCNNTISSSRELNGGGFQWVGTKFVLQIVYRVEEPKNNFLVLFLEYRVRSVLFSVDKFSILTEDCSVCNVIFSIFTHS